MFGIKENLILSIGMFLFLMCSFSFVLAETNEIKENNIIDIESSFTSLRSVASTISEADYFDFIRISIIEQPEYLFANSSVTEKNMILKYEKRTRWPELSAKIINDEVLDRNIDDKNSLRKRQDDSFDAAIELNQPIYTGGAINSRIKIATNDYDLSRVSRASSLSSLILSANEIYLSAVRSEILYNYCSDILDTLRPYMTKVKDRVNLGITDPIELAIFSIKYNNIDSKVQTLRTQRDRDVGIFEYFFKTKFENFSFPEVFVPRLSFNNNEAYEVRASRLQHKISLNETNLVRSEYLPKFGFSTRYTSYDLDKDNNDTDIRGGLFFSMPIFTFGRATAKISAAKAKANASKMSIDIEKKTDEVSETEIINMVEGSHNTRKEFYLTYIDTKRQREIIGDRIDVTSFSTESYANSYLEEIFLLEKLINAEISMLHGYFLYLHQNRALSSHIRISP